MKFNLFYALILLPAFGFAQESPAEKRSVRVAVFQDEGVGKSVSSLMKAIQGSSKYIIKTTRISADEIRSGGLQQVDILVHPGGSGGKQGKALQADGREAVRKFVDSGGGFMGVCAGAYLATNDYSWSLDLIDAKVTDRRHWARGKGMVEIKLSPTGSELFQTGGEREFEIFYAQGPLLSRREWDDPKVPNYESLAIYNGEIAKNGAPRGVMARTSAIVRSEFGKGKVICFSPHPESTKGKEKLIGYGIEWLANSD